MGSVAFLIARERDQERDAWLRYDWYKGWEKDGLVWWRGEWSVLAPLSTWEKQLLLSSQTVPHIIGYFTLISHVVVFHL